VQVSDLGGFFWERERGEDEFFVGEDEGCHYFD
jgi:hypothetical protein